MPDLDDFQRVFLSLVRDLPFGQLGVLAGLSLSA